MRLTLHELIKIFNIVIQYFKQQDVKEISFAAEDYYPQILREMLDFENPDFLKCPHFGLGSLDFDLEVWKNILNEEDAVYGICGEIIRKLGGILTSFGQVSDKLNNPALIENRASFQNPPPKLTINDLQEIFNLVIRSLKMRYNSSDISFKDPRYIKIALKSEYLGMECPPYTIASLDDCIETWKGILGGAATPSALAIEQLGDLLTAFGEEIDMKTSSA